MPQKKKAVHFRLDPKYIELVDEAADAGTRNRSQQLERYTIEGLRRDGLLETREDNADELD